MAILENPKHELFAQQVAQGQSARAAYRAAGYNVSNDASTDAAASRLLSHGKVRDRVAEIQRGAGESAGVTIEGLIAEAEAARELAMKNDQPSAAVSALTAKAKLAGLWVEKSKTEIEDLRGRPIQELSSPQLEAILAHDLDNQLIELGVQFLPDGSVRMAPEGEIGGVIYSGEARTEALPVAEIKVRRDLNTPRVNLFIGAGTNS